MKFKYFLFDWDGCLVDTLPIWFQGMKAGVAHFGAHASDVDIKKGFQSWSIFPKVGVTDMNVFTQKVYDYVTKCLGRVKFNEGVKGLLEQIRRKNAKSAIVTSADETKVLPVLERLKATEYFDSIVSRHDVKKLKPHTEPVEKALRELEGERKRAVMIGDSVVDIEAGKNAGISAVWYSTESNRSFHLDQTPGADPDMTISHMGELQNLIS